MELPNLATFTPRSSSALIILHEIYGINPYIIELCKKYEALNYDVYCPNLLGEQEAFGYEEQQTAYDYFMENVGFAASALRINTLQKSLREHYKWVFLMGSSVGATIAWICSSHTGYDGAVCLYGSRIREYLDNPPQCPALTLFAQYETSFAPEKVVNTLNTFPYVQAEIIQAEHGFCDNFSKAFNPTAAAYAMARAEAFFLSVQTSYVHSHFSQN